MTDEERVIECQKEIRRLRGVVRELEDELEARNKCFLVFCYETREPNGTQGFSTEEKALEFVDAEVEKVCTGLKAKGFKPSIVVNGPFGLTHRTVTITSEPNGFIFYEWIIKETTIQ